MREKHRAGANWNTPRPRSSEGRWLVHGHRRTDSHYCIGINDVNIGDYISNGEFGGQAHPQGGTVVGTIYGHDGQAVCYKVICSRTNERDDEHDPGSQFFDYIPVDTVVFHEPAGSVTYVENFGYRLRPKLVWDEGGIRLAWLYYNKGMRDWIYD